MWITEIASLVHASIIGAHMLSSCSTDTSQSTNKRRKLSSRFSAIFSSIAIYVQTPQHKNKWPHLTWRNTCSTHLLLLRQRLEVFCQVALTLHDLFLWGDLLLVDLTLQLSNWVGQLIAACHRVLKTPTSENRVYVRTCEHNSHSYKHPVLPVQQ